MKKEYYPQLDSLRGFASIQVLIGHCLLAVPGLVFFKESKRPIQFIDHIINSPLHFFWSDGQAVILFFILSGFVLALPYYSTEKKEPNYVPFFFKRIVRLYLPCLVIICISLLFRFFIYTPNQTILAGSWVKMMWTHTIDKNFLVNLFILKPAFLDYVDRALWSLNPEIKLSLILPFFSLFIRRLSRLQSVGFIFLYVVLYHGLVRVGVQNFWPDFVTLYYLTYFLIGVLLCKYRILLKNLVNSSNHIVTFILLTIAIYLYTFQYSAWWIYQPLYKMGSKITDQLAAAGGLIILIFALSDRFIWLYNHKLSIYLGKLSFSIYLVHTIVITSLFYLLSQYLTPWLIVLFSFLLTFPASWVFYKTVEHPSALLSKWVYVTINNKFKKTKVEC